MSYPLKSGRSTAWSALAAFLLAASPTYAMSTITTPANNNAVSRFTDPNAQPQRGFSGAMTTVIIGGGSGSFGYGGSVTAGSNGLGGGPYSRPEQWPRSDLGPSFPNRRPDSSPYGFNPNDPFRTPRDPYAPSFGAPGIGGNFR